MLQIPLPLPTANIAIDMAKKHWSLYAATKKRATTKVWACVHHAHLKPIAHSIMITMRWFPADRRADLDNISWGAKSVLDGLIVARILPDDGQKYVRGITHILCNPDAEKPRVEVTWVEVEI